MNNYRGWSFTYKGEWIAKKGTRVVNNPCLLRLKRWIDRDLKEKAPE